MIYSVMGSTILVGLGAWFDLWDVSAGVSIKKLTILSAVGLALGIVTGLGDLAVRRLRRHLQNQELARQKEQQIGRGDDEATLLGKILELPPGSRLERPTIKTTDGEVFAGSLGALTPMPDGAPGELLYSLVGSFNIEWDKVTDESVKTRMKNLVATSKLRDLTALARQTNSLGYVQPIETKQGEEFEATEHYSRQWNSSEVSEVKTLSETWTAPTLDTK